MRKVSLIVGIVLMAAPSLVIAQVTTGSIEGYVRSSDGVAIPGADVTASGPDLQGSRTAVSGQDGYFLLQGLPVGTYEIRVTAADYGEAVLAAVTVHLGRATNLGTIDLGERAYELDALTVTSLPRLIDPGETAVGGNLIAEEYGELPIDRSYRGLAAILPHVQASYFGDDLNFAGATGMENKWYVDGVDVTDPVGGASAMELPYNFVREVQVRTGGYQAEYRGAQGGVVDVVTHSGGNEMRSQVFGFFLNDKTVATPRTGLNDPDQGSFARWDVGAGISGPLARDRLWYSVAYNPAFDSEDVDVPGISMQKEERTTHRLAAKLDWRVNDGNDLTLSVVGDPGTRDGVDSFPAFIGTPGAFASADALLVREDSRTIATSLKGHHYVGDAGMLESTLSYVLNRHDLQPRTAAGDELLFWDHETDVVSGGILEKGTTDGKDLTLGLAASWQLGAHSVKIGGEYRENRVDIDDDGGYLERYFDPDANTEQYVLSTWYTRGEVANRTPAAFVQDSWRLGDRLRLNLGVRWNAQYLVDSQGDVAITINDQWQPRFGATYLLGADRRAKIFGSAGRFYQDLSLYGPSALLIDETGYRVTLFDQDPRVDPSGGDVIYDAEGSLVDDLRGQHYDELTLGYERQVGTHGKVTVRGIYRELREAIEDSWSAEAGKFVWGNPGRGLVAEFPRPSRDYTALELTYQISGADKYNALASYVLSRNRGNTTGIFPSDYGFGNANMGPQWDELEQTVNGHGLLPNDRTHVVKLAGSWRAGYGLTVGGVFSWMKGSPLNEFGAGYAAPAYLVFLEPRGSAGRLPDLWDLSLRFTYDIGYLLEGDLSAKVLLDLLHINNAREVTNQDQKRYLAQDDAGNQVFPNPTYGMATAYQPPFAVRLGVEVDF